MSQQISGLHLERVELLDGSGRWVASATSEIELRRVAPGRSNLDFSRQGTLDLDGCVPGGEPLRLWMHGRLGALFDEIAAANPAS